MSAIYYFLSDDVVGIKPDSLRNTLPRQDGVYINKRCQIRVSQLLQKPKASRLKKMGNKTALAEVELSASSSILT